MSFIFVYQQFSPLEELMPLFLEKSQWCLSGVFHTDSRCRDITERQITMMVRMYTTLLHSKFEPLPTGPVFMVSGFPVMAGVVLSSSTVEVKHYNTCSQFNSVEVLTMLLLNGIKHSYVVKYKWLHLVIRTCLYLKKVR